ncbi:hypothetical protein AJ78_08885 [Emergomyces pasteurianus Ep9510]|uniref:Uncharacterized protein n=1 Tax=Emergomyces pasteurianus Ep9510 TaxID=1447872 RepID=A0A1J9Q0T5_9EURO|nr:hypothetical protein AJ78_08885 [Emergomyces pasteurianus Ep9510]
MKLYVLRDAAAKGFNKNSNVSNSLQNLMLQHHLPWPRAAEGLNEDDVLDEPKQRARIELKHKILERYQQKQPVIDSERQLFRKIVDENIIVIYTVSAYCDAEEESLCRQYDRDFSLKSTTVKSTAVKAEVMAQSSSNMLLESAIQAV